MKHIIVACADFTTVSGAPMFVHDLSRELTRRGHKVTVTAPNVGGLMAEKTRAFGVECVTNDQAKSRNPDILHVNGMGPAHWAVSHYPHKPAVATVHSQLIYEKPLVHPNIKHYACVRPEIMHKIVGEDGVPWSQTSVIYNGIDTGRFREGGEKFDPPTILFAGTVDYLRAQASHMTMDYAKERGMDVAFIGRRLSGQLDDLPGYARHLDRDVWEIEEITPRCVMTAGILLGRTLFEGWACGIPGLVYEIDTEGHVTKWSEYAPPPPQIMAMFDLRFMVDMYERLYERTIG